MQNLPKKTYSRKRIRSSSTAPLTSSPSVIGDVDISVSDMSQRMLKRSRNNIKGKKSSANRVQDGDAENSTMRPLKRTKSGARSNLASQNVLKDKNQNISESSPIPAKEKMDFFIFPDFLQVSPTADMSKKFRNHVKTLTSSPLKENKAPVLSSKTQSMLTPHDNTVITLASPFKARSPIASSTPIQRDRDRQRKLSRTRSSANLSRRRSSIRSSNIGNATHIEPSDKIRRRPSAQISSSHQKKPQSDWLVPAQLSGVLTSALAQKSDAKSKFGSADFTFDFTAFKETFQVPPIACSTPATGGTDFPIRRTPESYHPLPTYDMNEDLICDIPGTRIRNSDFSKGFSCDSGDPVPSRQAIGPAVYAPPKPGNTDSLADELERVMTREGRRRELSGVSQTGELQELFSDLGLHGLFFFLHWTFYFDNWIADTAEHNDGKSKRVPASKQPKKATRSDHRRMSSSKAILIGSNTLDGNGKHLRKEGNRRRGKTSDGSVRLNSLGVDEDDEDDELLLTSKGWDWDPVKG